MTNSAIDSSLHDAPWLGKLLARLVLRLPRFSPFRLSSGYLNAKLRSQGAKAFVATSGDGVRIDALFMSATKANAARLPVIMNHGYTEIKEFHQREAKLLQEHGHDVILYDLRAHGRSGGRVTTLGALEKQDLTAVIDAAVRLKFIEGRVITYGYSTGAAIVIQHAPLDDRVAAIVAIVPFVDVVSAIKSFREFLGGWYDEAKLLRGFAAVAAEQGYSFDDTQTNEAMKRITVPLLLVAAANDRNLPSHLHAEPLAELFPHAHCEFLRIEGAGHVSIYRRAWPNLNEALLRFCAGIE